VTYRAGYPPANTAHQRKTIVNMDSFVNEKERQAALECAQHLRDARASLRQAYNAAVQAGYGSMMLGELADLVTAVNEFRSTYDQV
jgi:hypothetical protein